MGDLLKKLNIKNQKDSSQLEKQELLDAINEAAMRLRIARMFFESVSEPELIDACVYEINSLQAHYSYLLNKAKKEELQSFNVLKIPR
ncbi:MAG: YaaL family protein [Clostridiales bacterium]|nr:YaaL family protein [Clostridiales bacterium]